MSADRYDLIVLGSGSAARDGAGKASREFGARVAMVEHRLWGGSCPNVACRPTKAYVVAAELMHDVEHHAAERGIDLPKPTIDLARTRVWKNSIRRDQESWVQLLKDAGYGVFPGTATFVDAQTVRVGDQELSAERVLVATGSRTAVPPIPGIEGIDWLDHISALELEDVPESLLIVGAGPVGLELAQIFARFGSRVTIVNHGPQIAARSDTEAAAELQAALEDEGISVVLNAGVESFSRNGGRIEAAVAGMTVSVSHVLLASGRKPNVEELEVDRIGLAATRGRITVDDRQRTSVDGVWAAGDVADGPMLTPIAQYQARIAIEDMFGDGSRRADYSVLPTAIFTDPELGGVGLTEAEASEQGFDVDVVKHPLSAVTRAQYTGAKHGLYKIVFDRETRRVLGVHVVSRGASDIVGSLTPAVKLGVTVDDLAFMHHVYPSYSEGLKAAAEKALATVRT
ncbi:MAG: NAD(P)/FAD-dependent oxidoreductase [Actinobacteria bacterium]|nr:MAG: NAD(P)/FAD-dependent oxidoreductase [Actinomycetota bacterium]